MDPEAHLAPSVLGLALLQTGRPTEAARWANQALELATARGYRVFLPELFELSGTVAISEGRWREADDFLTKGLSIARGMSMRYHEARLLFQLGVAQTQRGAPEPGRATLLRALAAFERLGARPHWERTQRALDALKDEEVGSPN